MKQIVFAVLIGTLLFAACGQTPSATQTAPISAVDTTTPSPLPTATQTSLPTATPTASITPLPTIPTFTPTFDASTIVTVTPAPKAECKNETQSEVAQYLSKELNSTELPIFIDVTNDGLDEIILIGKSKDEVGVGSVFIYSCQGETYSVLEKVSALFDPLPKLSTVQDLNQNGIAEIVLAIRGCGGFGSCWFITILEWDGSNFQNLENEQMNQNHAPWLDKISFVDINHDGIIEIVIDRGLPSHPDKLSDGTWRRYTEIYSWNGEYYVLKDSNITAPQFRFQAIQDADQETTNFQYERALALYQDAIFSGELAPWSFEQFIYSKNNLWTDSTAITPTPVPDITEYPRLAAYAYYRIILVHFVQNHESDAGTVYNTLQKKFGNDPYARPYVEMATAFWNAYQSTHKMYDGCAAAIQYAAEHPEILIPLGSDYHGAQSHTYVPADVCPFR
jgi:hypothetical protein